MLFVMFYLFRDRDYLLRRVRDLLPLTRAEGDRVFAGIVNSIHANLYATVVGASINGFTSGLVFWAVGLPSPVLWGTVVFVLSIVPVLGNVLVWIPATLYLALMGRWWGAAAVLGWGVSSAILVDTLLFVRMAGNGMRMHKLPTLLAYIGGLAVFGMAGLVLGPAILAICEALLVVWHERAANNGEPVSKLPSGEEPATLVKS
jgi:predicted PurR-regulated permease PerM